MPGLQSLNAQAQPMTGDTSIEAALAALSPQPLSFEQRIAQDVENKAKEGNWNPLQKSSYGKYLNKFYDNVRKLRGDNVATFFHITPEELEGRLLDFAFDNGLDLAYGKLRRWNKLVEDVKGWNEGMTTDQFQVYLNPDGTMTMGVKKPKGPYAGKDYEEVYGAKKPEESDAAFGTSPENALKALMMGAQ